MLYIYTLYIYIHYIYIHIYRKYIYNRCQKYRTEVEEYEGTVIYRTLLFHNSIFPGRYEKKNALTYSFFLSSFYNSGLFCNCAFPHLSHIYQFRSIILFVRSMVNLRNRSIIMYCIQICNYRTEKLIIEQKKIVVEEDPNPRNIGIRRSTKVRYFTVFL